MSDFDQPISNTKKCVFQLIGSRKSFKPKFHNYNTRYIGITMDAGVEKPKGPPTMKTWCIAFRAHHFPTVDTAKAGPRAE